MPFDFEVPVDFFEKADAPEGKQRRIGGIASLETKDRQQEVVLQRGLDWRDFKANGWFNDNHSRDTDGILGYPEEVQFFRKGQTMPNGKKAPAAGHWVEGYLLNTQRADRIWELGKALAKTKRRLGFSVEGKINERTGPGQRTIAKALVRNVAITNAPVNADARMEILAKSLQSFDKAMGMGEVADPGQAVVGPKTGMGAGRVVTNESLEKERKQSTLKFKEKKKKKFKKSLSDSEAFAWFKSRLPNANAEQIGKLIRLSRELKANGKL